jgi:hypothetical protein
VATVQLHEGGIEWACNRVAAKQAEDCEGALGGSEGRTGAPVGDPGRNHRVEVRYGNGCLRDGGCPSTRTVRRRVWFAGRRARPRTGPAGASGTWPPVSGSPLGDDVWASTFDGEDGYRVLGQPMSAVAPVRANDVAWE